MFEQSKEIDELIQQNYVPSSVERKKTLLMYMFFGIVISLIQKELTKYEMFHLKQAIGWWALFFVLLVPAVVFIIFPYFFWLISALIFIILMIIWIVFIRQAWKGQYTSLDKNKIVLPLFAGIGGWILDIFEFQIDTNKELIVDNNVQPANNQSDQPKI